MTTKDCKMTTKDCKMTTYLTSPQGQQKVVNAARRIKDLYDFRNPNVRRTRR